MLASHTGNLRLGNTIIGKNVVLYAENGNISYRGEDEASITAANQLIISGKDVDLPAVSGGGSTAVTAEEYKAVHIGNANYTGLEVTNALIEVEKGILSIERLGVSGNGSFKAEGFDSSVIGANGSFAPNHHVTYFDINVGATGTGGAGRYNLGEVVGFNDLMDINDVKDRIDNMGTIIGNLEKNIDDIRRNPIPFGGDNDGWMNLYIDDSHHQRSNGLLLDIDDYYYSGYQRLSMRDLCGKEDSFTPQAVFFDLMPQPLEPPPTQGTLNLASAFAEIVTLDSIGNAAPDELVVAEE